MVKYLILLNIVSLFIIPLYVGVERVGAQSYYFQDEFDQQRPDNTLDSTKWDIYPNSKNNFVTIKENNGVLQTTQQTNTNQYPLIISKKPIPAGDFSVEIKFQYTKVTHWGTGIALSQRAPKNGKVVNTLLTISVWQDKSVGPNMRVNFDGTDVFTTITNTQQHILKVDRTGRKYLVFLDSKLIYTSPDTPEQVQHIWMGNPSFQNPPIPDWTQFNIDYVRVISFAPEPFLELPWDYKSKGLTFNEAALTINSFFDHEYPLLSSSLIEPLDISNSIISYAGPPRSTEDYSSHDGYDYGKVAKANLGDPVLAAASGWATYINNCSACGHVIAIDHQNGYQTRYYHLLGKELITKSTKVWVNTGDKIGQVGSTGNSTGAHIHFMVVQDKEGDGDFENNLPDGVTDPFGWQSKNLDPWESYSFSYNGQNRNGNRSYYLWKNKLDNLNATLTTNGGVFNTGRYNINFPTNTTNKDLELNIKSSPLVQISDTLHSIGSSLSITAEDFFGNLTTQFQSFFTITADFSSIDLSRFNINTISFYSSSDGTNWTKEPTTIDLNNKTADTKVNHLTHFALVAERIDTTPPKTEVTLEGTKGEPNWFRSNVTVTLIPEDNEESLGVDYTFYKINNQEKQLYNTPFILTEEGSYKIEYYSVDKDENSENPKSIELNIDKTVPEVQISFDIINKKIKIEGLDNSNATKIEISPKNEDRKRQILIKDQAGNTLNILGNLITKKNSEDISIKTLQYNDSPIVSLIKNEFFIKYSFNENSKIENIFQFIRIKDEKITLEYSPKKNRTYIIIKDADKLKKKETSEGLKNLQLYTEKGTLKYSY